jgi:hypothetical protein
MRKVALIGHFGILAFASVSLVITLASCAVVPSAYRESELISIEGWEKLFALHYDYVVAEMDGLYREYEPVEITLSEPGGQPLYWQQHIRVVRLESDNHGVLVPHQTLGMVSAVAEAGGKAKAPAPAESVNLIFLARCPANSEVTYRLFWALPKNAETTGIDLPAAKLRNGLDVSGKMPALVVDNEYYTIQLDEKSGAIKTSLRADQGRDKKINFFQKVPIHFGTDIWSPPQSWDHDYDWQVPPNQKCEGGPIAFRYHRWGPLRKYPDVISSITYTFYAHVPYVHVSSTMEFTADRSARVVRMGEIVVTNTKTPEPDKQQAEEELTDVFSHFAWPNEDGSVFTREINAHRDAEGSANIESIARGALGILDRDVPWVAGYNAQKGYGIASLRKSQFAGNRLGGPIPYSAPCTYIANYGWGFAYWSRPMIYPMGMKGTALDQNMAIAAGTIYAIEEALLIFEPDASFSAVRNAHRQFTKPLRLQFKGAGPW